MPNVKDVKDKSSKKAKPEMEETLNPSSEARPKRRPGREEPEASMADVRVVDVEEGLQAPNSETMRNGDAPDMQPGTESQMSFEAEPEKPKVEIRFFGSELIRSRFSKPFEVAEAVATEWVHGGDFAKLPIDHPLAQYAAQKGLQKAKEIEKKVLESPVTEKVAMQVLTAGMKAQGVIEQVRSKLQKKDNE